MYPVSSFDSRFQISRDGEHGLTWNEKVARRRRGVELDSDSTESPPPESLLPRSPPAAQSQKLTGRKCSSCSCRRSDTSIRKHSVSSTSVKREESENKMRDVGIHQLEAKLYNMELKEATRMEDLEKIQEQFERSSQILEALGLYTQSLDLKARSLVRLTNLTENFAYKDLTPSDSLPQVLDKMMMDMNILEKLSEVEGLLMSASKTSEQVYQLMEDLKEKRKRYLSTANEFSQYLRSCGSVSTSRLRKYECQYEGARAACENSRRTLEKVFSKLINERHESLVEGLSKLVPIQEILKQQDDQFCELSIEISKCLQGPFKKQSSQNICVSKQQRCKSSSINR